MSTDGDRSKFFSAIEKKHGEKVAFGLEHLKDLDFLASGVDVFHSGDVNW